MEEIEYRHPCESDLEIITDIANRSNRELPHHREGTVEEFRSRIFEDDDYDPAGYLLAFIDGEPVAHGGSMVNKARLESGMKDARIIISVVPKHRGNGIEQHLVRHACVGVNSCKNRGFYLLK